MVIEKIVRKGEIADNKLFSNLVNIIIIKLTAQNRISIL